MLSIRAGSVEHISGRSTYPEIFSFLPKKYILQSDRGAESFIAERKDVQKHGTAFVSVSSDVVFLILANLLAPAKLSIVGDSCLAWRYGGGTTQSNAMEQG